MKRVMNLDGNFMPFPIVEVKFNKFKFPGGEVHIRLNQNTDYSKIEKVLITHRMSTMDDFMEIALAVDALRREGIKDIELFIPYLPYARQDRVCSPGDAFSVQVLSRLINTLFLTRVMTLDTHSPVASTLIYNHVDISPINYINEVVQTLNDEDLIWVVPDKGARPKAIATISEIGGQRNTYKGIVRDLPVNDMVFCQKNRDPKTGKLSGFTVEQDDLLGADCLIVDDICDGGGTFIGLAKELKKKNAGNLHLFVTHGIFSKGTDVLLDYFTNIFTTNSIANTDHMFVSQLKINLDETMANCS